MGTSENNGDALTTQSEKEGMMAEVESSLDEGVDISNLQDIELVKRFIQLEKEKSQLEKSLKDVKFLMASLQDPLQNWMGSHGMQKITCNDRTVYMKTNQFIRRDVHVPHEEFCCAMRESGLEHLVKENVNANSLQATIREMIEEGGIQAVPEALRKLLVFSEQTVCVSRTR
jgi:hypothetical protein